MKRLTIFWLCLTGAALLAQPTAETRPELDKTAAVDMTPAARGESDKPRLPFTTDSQVRVPLFITQASSMRYTLDATVPAE